MRPYSFILIGMFITFQSLAQYKGPVQLNRSGGDSYYPNEPSVCIPRVPGAVRVAAANINHHFYSADEGGNWDELRVSSSLGVWGDPVLHATPDGKVYLAHLSHTDGKGNRYGFIDRIVVQRSDDTGRTFNDGVGIGLNGEKMQDKPWLSSDDHSDRFKGSLYCSWTEFDKINSKKKKHRSRIRFAVSRDEGNTWSDAVTVSDGTGGSRDDDNTLEGATTCADRKGNLYCVWAGHNKLYFDRSVDGGKTWGTDRVIAEQRSGWVMEIPHVYRCNGMPFLGVDNSGGQHDGRLYVVYGDTSGTDADIFIIHSDDGGDTWTPPRQINGDHLESPKDQYLPNFSIDQKTGKLYVVFQDRRDDESNVFARTTLAVGDAGGESWKEFSLTNVPTAPHGKKTFSGDYNDVDVRDGQIAAVWTEFEKYSRIYGYFGTETDVAMMANFKIPYFKYYVFRTGKKYHVAVSGTPDHTFEIEFVDKKMGAITHTLAYPESAERYSGQIELGKLKKSGALLKVVNPDGSSSSYRLPNR